MAKAKRRIFARAVSPAKEFSPPRARKPAKLLKVFLLNASAWRGKIWTRRKVRQSEISAGNILKPEI